jgi:hypothetical protein
MPIEFLCTSCQAKIRTPDNSAGRQARCPKCSAVVTVPAASMPPPAPQSGFSAPPAGFIQPPSSHPLAGGPPKPASNPLSGPPANPLGAPTPNPLGGPPPGSAPNPFGEKQPSPFGSAVPNPYASPSAAGAYFQPAKPAYGSREAVRPWLLGPAIGSTIIAVCGLVFMAMVVLGMTLDPNQVFKDAPQDPAERAGFYGFFVIYFAGGLITRLIQLVGAISLFRVRGYGLAMAAMICALLPCDVYCCIFSLPFGIWGLIMLNKPDVKAAFQLP